MSRTHLKESIRNVFSHQLRFAFGRLFIFSFILPRNIQALRPYVYVFFVFQTSVLFASTPDALRFSMLISADSLREKVYILASDYMEGRETGRRGQKKAAEYISNTLLDYGVIPLPGKKNFIQHHSLSLKANRGYNIEVHQKFYLYLEDYFYIPGYHDTTIVLDKIVFAGYGIKDTHYDDYENLEVKGRPVMFYEGEPPLFSKKKSRRSNTIESHWSLDWKKKLRVIYDKKPSMVFIITNNLSSLADSLLEEMNNPEFYMLARAPEPIPVVFISEEMALNFFPEYEQASFIRAKNRIDRKGRPDSFRANTQAEIKLTSIVDKLKGENLAVMIEGNTDEYVVVSAHYDHLGIIDSVMHRGADDNASGTAALLEMARIFSEMKKEGIAPKRSMVFLFFSGEEKGLLGSAYFTDNPLMPLSSIVTNLNMDMLGRTDSLHDSLGVKEYVYIIGSDRLSKELHEINEVCNSTGPGLHLSYRFNADDEPNQYYYRSDQYHFAKNNIPVIFYFNGIHSDYHKPGDTVDKIDYELLAKRTRLVFLTAWELAARDKRVKLNK